MCHIYGEVGAEINRVMGYYTLLNNNFIKTLYYRGNIPDADLHSFYSDFVVALFLDRPDFKMKLLHNVNFSWEERRLDMINFCQLFTKKMDESGVEKMYVPTMSSRMMKWLELLGSEKLARWRSNFEHSMFRRGSAKQRDVYSVFFFMLLQCEPPEIEDFEGFDVNNPRKNVFFKIQAACEWSVMFMWM